MGHILYGGARPSITASDDAWIGVGAEVGKYVNTRSHRTDITAVLGASLGGPFGTACFIPSLAEIQINTGGVPLGNPDKVDLHDDLWCLEHAPAVGAMEHEAAHARHTKWDPRDLMSEYGATRKMIDVITTLEEPRIEAHALRWRPESRPFLRGCAMEIVCKDFHISDTRYGAASAAGLLLARVDAKVLTRGEAATFRKDILAVLGEDTLGTLEAIWQNHLMLRDDDYEAMVVNAFDWLAALGEDPEDPSDMAGEGLMGETGEGESGEGEGEGEGSGSGEGDSEGEGGSEDGEGEGEGEGDGTPKGFGDKIKGKAARAEVKMDGEIVTARGGERADRRRKEREADAARHKDAEGPHEDAFGKPGGHAYTPGGFAHLTGEREPTSDERRAARSLSKALEQIDYRDRAVSKVNSVVPPGRLRGRAAVQQDALRAKGQDAEVAVWTGKRRKRVESTPLTIGFAVDISGSMSSAMGPLGSTQWVVSTAGSHIDAKVASVHFGDRVHGVTPAGVREKTVRIFYPGDGSEYFRGAALALDKELDLLDGRGARILFIASDGVFVNDDDADYARRFIPLAARKGVAVIFLDFTGSMGFGSYGATVINCQRKTPAEVATLCGKAAIGEIQRLDRKV